LLGWRTELEQSGSVWAGSACRILGRQEVKVRTRAQSRAQALVELFEAAVALGATGSAVVDPRADGLVA
jgi:hypothetical protein